MTLSYHDFLKSGTLPQDEKKAREVFLSHSYYLHKNDVLFYVGKEESLRIILPKLDWSGVPQWCVQCSPEGCEDLW